MSVQLRGARALVTGGAGFIGSHIVEALIRAGAARVVVVDDFSRGSRDNLPAAAWNPSVEVVQGDICDPGLVDELSDGIDLVFHQAALRITQCAEDPVRAMKVMVGGTQNVLEAAVRKGVARVILASSASVYGEPDRLPIEESAPFHNRTVYGAAKIAGEQLARAYAERYGLRYLALRPFNVYGPRMDTFGLYTEVMIRWLDRLADGLPPIIYGNGTQSMDFVFVSDVTRAYMLAATSSATDDVVNVGTGVETSLSELCRLMCALSGDPEMTPLHEAPRKVNGVTRRRASTVHARDLIGFEAQVDLRAGLAQLLDWYTALDRSRRAAV